MVGLRVEFMPLVYVVCMGGIILMLNRVASYDVRGISRDSIEESSEYGFVVCDSRCRFCSADEQARHWFPELDSLRIDYRIEGCSTDFLKQLRSWVEDGDQKQTARFVREGRSLELTHSMPKSNHRTLHCVQIRDNTQQRYLDLAEHYTKSSRKKSKKRPLNSKRFKTTSSWAWLASLRAVTVIRATTSDEPATWCGFLFLACCRMATCLA